MNAIAGTRINSDRAPLVNVILSEAKRSRRISEYFFARASDAAT
jgi:hypothetical protein